MLSLKSLQDDDLLNELARLVKQSRGVEVDVVAHIGEVERRRLYAREACSSMFEYCRRVLGLRENEAYLRITVARAAREHPNLLEMLRDGRLHLSGIARLAPHLTRENVQGVLMRASGKSHREVRELVAALEPRSDVAAAIRKLPALRSRLVRPTGSASPADGSALQPGAPRVEPDAVKVSIEPAEVDFPVPAAARSVLVEPPAPARCDLVERISPARPAIVEPLAPDRYQVRFTASAGLREKLERLKALMRTSVPDGDLTRIIDIAVSEKLQRVEARRFGKRKNPRSESADTKSSAGSGTQSPSRPSSKAPTSRHIRAAVRRLVYERDGGRCTYRDATGRRCGCRQGLEFHHKHPFAHGGDHSPDNLTLLCKAHNALIAEHDYGTEAVAPVRPATSRAFTAAVGTLARTSSQAEGTHGSG